MTAGDAAGLTAAIAAVGVMIEGFEGLAVRRHVVRAFDWNILSTYSLALRRPTVRRVSAAVVGHPRTLPAIAVVRIVAAPAAALALYADSPLAVPACLAVVISAVIAQERLIYGFDGADQMQGIVWACLTIYAIAPGNASAELALLFVATQFVLAYITAGLAKALSEDWRSGAAMPGILSTYSYGGALSLRMLGSQRLGRVACWGVIVFETVGPLVAVAAGGDVLIAFAVAAVGFHVSIALAMGLNNFVWAFASALPCLVYAAERLHTAL